MKKPARPPGMIFVGDSMSFFVEGGRQPDSLMRTAVAPGALEVDCQR